VDYTDDFYDDIYQNLDFEVIEQQNLILRKMMNFQKVNWNHLKPEYKKAQKANQKKAKHHYKIKHQSKMKSKQRHYMRLQKQKKLMTSSKNMY